MRSDSTTAKCKIDRNNPRVPLRRRGGKIVAYALIDSAERDWVEQYSWHLNPQGYACRAESYVTASGRRSCVNHLLHREVLGVARGQWVDHINRDRLDNRRENLRLIDGRGNAINSKMRSNNTSGYRGVSLDYTKQGKPRWIALVGVGGKQIRVAWCESKEEAARAYDKAAKKHHGEYAQLNFPEEA